MSLGLGGATRVYVILGDPITQVKAPGALTAALQNRGHDAVVVPIHVSPDHVDRFIDTMGPIRNLDGIIVTVPHKFAASRHCTSLSDRASFLGAVNMMRRNPDGSWDGDMLDGVSFLAAMRLAGRDPVGRRVLHVGAGGAGRAIALALAEAGVRDLAIHDEDTVRRDDLIARLHQAGWTAARVGSPDPAGADIVVNATPSGMGSDDPPPVDIARLSSAMHVGDVITVPEITPLLAHARSIGCTTQSGIDMFDAQLDLMVNFLKGQRAG